MPAKVDKFLQPGEHVVCRPKFDPDSVMNLLVGQTFFQALCGFAVGWIGFSPSKVAPLYGLALAVFLAALSLVVTVIVIFRCRYRVAITNRRLLVLDARRGPKLTDVALNDVVRVHGTTEGDPLPMQVELRDGRFVSHFDQFWDRGFGQAIAEASGPDTIKDGQTAAERIAGQLYRSDRLGAFAGMAVSAVSATLTFGLAKPVLGALSGPLAMIAMVPAIVLLIWFGMLFGRVTFPILAVLCLRPRYGAEEMREAFRLLAQRRLLPREKDECRRLQPLIWAVAGLLYGRRLNPIAAEGLNPQT